tara:strand:+ start:214 stop:420 length:207 start_codon:yes stop_codon:yes gene_type:complete
MTFDAVGLLEGVGDRHQACYPLEVATVNVDRSHETPAFTLNAYGYTEQERDRAAAAVLGEVLGAAFGT